MSLQTILQKAPLATKTKQTLLNRIAEEGETAEVTQAVKDALQEYIDSGFKTLGVAADPNDPTIASITSTLNNELDAIENELQETLENLSIDAAVTQAKANKMIDTAGIAGMKAKMAA